MRFKFCMTLLVVLLLALPQFIWAEEEKEEEVFELGDVVVTATKTEERVEDLPVAVSVITAEDIKRENIQNLDEALRHVTGAYAKRQSSIADSVVYVTLRGFPNAGQTMVLIDGQALNDAYSGSVTWGGLPVENIERIEVIKGPSSALYGGNAMGGVINIITKTPKKRSIRIKGGYGTEDTKNYGIYYDDRFFDRLSISLGFENKETEGFVSDFAVVSSTTSGTGTPVTGWESTKTTQGEDAYVVGDKGKTWGENRSYNAKLSFDITPEHSLSFGVIESVLKYGREGGKSYLKDAAGNTVDSGKVEIDGKIYRAYPYNFEGGSSQKIRDIYSLKYEGEFTDCLTLKASAGLTDGRKTWYTTPYSGKTGYGAKGGELTESPGKRWQYEVQTDIILGENNLLTLGVGYQTDEAENTKWKLDDWKNRSDKGEKIFEISGKDKIYSVFIQDKHEFPYDITMFVGGRYDYWETYDGKKMAQSTGIDETYDSRHDDYFSPKIGLNYRAYGNLTLRGSAGYAYRWPSVYELYGGFIWSFFNYVGNPDLKPETTKSWDAGVDWRVFEGKTLFKATYFENYIEDLIYTAKMDPTDPRYVPGKLNKIYINAGKAEIKGIELGVEQRITSWLDGFANFTYTDAKIIENKASPDSEGKQLTFYPEKTASVGLYFHKYKMGLALTGDYTSKAYKKDDNSDTTSHVLGSSDEHFVVDAKFTYALAKFADISVSVNNVFDEDYYEYYKAPGRTALAELRLHF
ncbi:MAG: TonB-dependent receptor [Pseudomonadota bacterium]